MNDIPIADRVLEALSHGHADLPAFTHSENRALREALGRMVRSARRYYFDEESTWAASHLGSLHPELLLAGLSRARAPFERTLIDYDVWAFLRAGGREPAHDAPKRSCVIIERKGNTRFLMSSIGVLNPEKYDRQPYAVLNAVSVEYDVEDKLANPSDQELFRHAWRLGARRRGLTVETPDGRYQINPDTLTDDTLDHVLISALVGSAYKRGLNKPIKTDAPMVYGFGSEKGKEKSEEEEMLDKQVAELTSHGRWILSPSLAPAFRRLMKEDPGTWGPVIEESITEFAGQWRLIITMLELIIGQDFITETTFKAGTRPRMLRGHIIPYLEHRRVSLKVPRDVVVKKTIQRYGEVIPRRRHEVAGHYRHRRGVGLERGCEHVFVHLTETRERCELCQYDRWWVNEFERGDASLGYVTKDRVVETKLDDIGKLLNLVDAVADSVDRMSPDEVEAELKEERGDDALVIKIPPKPES